MDVFSVARAWAEADPDPETQQEILELIAAQDEDELTDRFGESLTFGTAGIRGEVAAGSSRMNRAVVIRTTYGLARFLEEIDADGPVIVAFDARPSSRQFAEDASGVLAAHGFDVRYFPEVTPTPVAAFAAKKVGALAAVVVTASHNPPRDNGYKVYGTNAAQIVPPTDETIQEHITGAPAANLIPRVEGTFSGTDTNVRPIPEEVFDEYWSEIDRTRIHRDGSDLVTVYTPLHGVGGAPLLELMQRAGHRRVVPVEAQFSPDGEFPTVDFPNPEEPGALDLAIDTATREGAELIIANDPDADRLAVAVPDGDGWRVLTGNEIGALLADYLLGGSATRHPIVASSIVSSPMLDLVARTHGALRATTLTGFKWIMAAALALEEDGRGEFVFGYEEALGYSVGRTVRDKDGLSAAVVILDLAAHLKRTGSSLQERLDELADAHGLWTSAQVSVKRDDTEGATAIRDAIANLAASPPASVGGHDVLSVTDYRTGGQERPPWLGEQDLIQLDIDGGRVLVRPSGTEPKMKIYVDLVSHRTDDLENERRTQLRRAAEVGQDLADLMGV